MFKLAMKMMKKELKSSLFYLFMMTITIAINFVFTATSNTKMLSQDFSISSAGVSDTQNFGQSFSSMLNIAEQVPASDYLNAFIVLFCCFLIFYVNNNFIYNKKSEIAILTVSGASTSQIIFYFLLQTALVFLVACIPGIILGYFGVGLFFNTVAQIMHTTPGTLTSESLIQTGILIFTIFIYMVFYIYAYIVRLKIKDLLANKNAVRIVNEVPPRYVPSVVFFLLFAFGVGLMFYPGWPYDDYTLQFLLGFVGLYGILFGFITDVVKLWKKYRFHKHPLATISVSNYNASILTSKWTILILVFSVTAMFYVTIFYSAALNEFILSVAGYMIAVILLSLTVTFDLTVQAKQRTTYYVNLWKNGYTRRQIRRIIRQELFLFYTTIIINPLLLIGPLGYKYVQVGKMNADVCQFMLIFFVGFVVLTGILSYFLYRHTTMKAIVNEK